MKRDIIIAIIVANIFFIQGMSYTTSTLHAHCVTKIFIPPSPHRFAFVCTGYALIKPFDVLFHF